MDNIIQTIKLEEIEKRLNSLNKSLKSEESNIVLLSDYISNLKDIIGMLRMNIETLFGLDPNFFSYCDTFDINSKRWGVGSVRTDRIFFVCTPGIKTYIKITGNIFYKLEDDFEPYFRALLNSTNLTDGIIYEKNFKANHDFSTKIEFTYSFIPTKQDNMIMLLTHAGTTDYLKGTSGFDNIKVEIIGYNVAILSRKYDFRLFITKNNYYITKNLSDHSEYLKAPINNIDLSAPFNLVDNVKPTDVDVYKNRLHFYNVTYVPEVTMNNEKNGYLINENQNMFYLSYSYNSLVLYTKQNPLSNEFSQFVPVNKGTTYTVGHPIYPLYKPYNIGNVYSNYDCNLYVAIALSNKLNEFEMLLNNEKISGIWVDNCSVFAKDWEDHFGERKQCYVATTSLAEVYFFDSELATYKLYIGKGHQVSAFMQSDLSINVYMKWLNNIHKKVLILNPSTNKYEVQDDEEIIENAWEYLEGYGNDYFINRMGTWEYVPN